MLLVSRFGGVSDMNMIHIVRLTHGFKMNKVDLFLIIVKNFRKLYIINICIYLASKYAIKYADQ